MTWVGSEGVMTQHLSELSREEVERYSRQLILKEVGVEGQLRLRGSKVAIFGVGGLGSVVLYFLAAAGVGTIYIVDKDPVELSNLNRQVLYTSEDVGRPKVEVAAERIRKVNPHVRVHALARSVDLELALDLAGKVDVLVDCLDNWKARHIVNEAAVKSRKPLVHAAVEEFYGHVLTVLPGKTPCLNCVFPRGGVRDRSPIPVLGAVVGAVACVEALETLKLLLGINPASLGTIVFLDFKSLSINKLKVSKNPKCDVCSRL